MYRFACFLSALLALTATGAACGSSTDDSTGAAGAAGAAGSAGSPASTTTLSCLIALSGFDPQCQFYEGTGADEPAEIAGLRAGCVDQSGAKAQVLDACPKAKTLGGCKSPVTVKGTADIKLFITNFEYEPTGMGTALHKTAAEVQDFCKSQGADTVYVASP